MKYCLNCGYALLSHIRRIPNHRIKPARLHDRRERGVPVEYVDSQSLLLVVEQIALRRLVVEIGADQRVAALDVASEVGQHAFAVEEPALRVDRFLRLALQHFQQQRELGHLDGLRVDVDAEDVVLEDALLFLCGQMPFAERVLEQLLVAFFGIVMHDSRRDASREGTGRRQAGTSRSRRRGRGCGASRLVWG